MVAGELAARCSNRPNRRAREEIILFPTSRSQPETKFIDDTALFYFFRKVADRLPFCFVSFFFGTDVSDDSDAYAPSAVDEATEPKKVCV